MKICLRYSEDMYMYVDVVLSPPPPAMEHHRLVGVDPSWFSGLKPKTQALADSVSAETPLPSFVASS